MFWSVCPLLDERNHFRELMRQRNHRDDGLTSFRLTSAIIWFCNAQKPSLPVSFFCPIWTRRSLPSGYWSVLVQQQDRHQLNCPDVGQMVAKSPRYVPTVHDFIFSEYFFGSYLFPIPSAPDARCLMCGMSCLPLPLPTTRQFITDPGAAHLFVTHEKNGSRSKKTRIVHQVYVTTHAPSETLWIPKRTLHTAQGTGGYVFERSFGTCLV